jgi:hypothetical protein
VKRSGREEPMWVAIHKCMEAIIRIFLYIYLYFKLAKQICLSYYLLFSLQQNWRTRGQNRFYLEVWGSGSGDVAQTMNIHVSKCKNKIKGEKNKTKRK